MTKLIRILLPPALLVVLAGTASAEELIPTPEFAEYEIPTSVPPKARSEVFEYLDLAALAMGLSLASYLGLVKRSRRGLFLLAIASFVWLGVWRAGCICPIGAIQDVTLAVFDSTYAVPLAVVAFFTLPLVFTLFFGRTFCAAVCPLGATQEFVAIWPIKVPAWLEHALGLLAYVYLGAAVLFAATGTAFVICRYDPFVAFFRRSGSANMLVFGGCFLLVGLFVGRPYCRYLCPYGAVLGLLSRVSKWHVKIPPEECIQCRLCEDVCPYGAIREPTIAHRADERRRGRRRLAWLILLLPLLVVLGAWLGTGLEVPLSKLHPTVRLAERIRLEERIHSEVQIRLKERSRPEAIKDQNRLEEQIRLGLLKQVGEWEYTTDASDAFRDTGEAAEDLYQRAFVQAKQFGVAGGWFGAWVGLVLGVKLIHLSVRRRRVDYQPDRANCLSCGRCFWYCPHEQARLGLIQDIRPVEKAENSDR